MSRYIDAEAFFKVINTLPYKDTSYPDASVYNGAISDVADMLTHFPAADVAPRWIPVTERVPEESGGYLVTYEFTRNGKAYRGITIAEWAIHLTNCDGDIIKFGEWYIDLVGDAVAWMPVPEPYKEGEQNE